MSAPPIHPLGLCLDCNYTLLTELSDHRCPECGREFDPADLRSVNLGKPLPHTARWALGPLSRKAMFVVLVALAFTLWQARQPDTARSTRTQYIIWIGIALLWLGWP